MKKITFIAFVLLSLPGCRGGGGGDNPGGYSDSYWADRRQKSDLAHRRREPGDRSNFVALLAVAAGVSAAAARRKA